MEWRGFWFDDLLCLMPRFESVAYTWCWRVFSSIEGLLEPRASVELRICEWSTRIANSTRSCLILSRSRTLSPFHRNGTIRFKDPSWDSKEWKDAGVAIRSCSTSFHLRTRSCHEGENNYWALTVGNWQPRMMYGYRLIRHDTSTVKSLLFSRECYAHSAWR